MLALHWRKYAVFKVKDMEIVAEIFETFFLGLFTKGMCMLQNDLEEVLWTIDKCSTSLLFIKAAWLFFQSLAQDWEKYSAALTITLSLMSQLTFEFYIVLVIIV